MIAKKKEKKRRKTRKRERKTAFGWQATAYVTRGKEYLYALAGRYIKDPRKESQ